MDSGASRCFGDVDSSVHAGLPRTVIKSNLGPPSQPITFETANGSATPEKSFGLDFPMIKGLEVFMMPGNSCFCMSMGEWVMRGQRPFVWIPGERPFLVTRADALRIVCPIRYRHYAVEERANTPTDL